jgi:hypothetical protein
VALSKDREKRERQLANLRPATQGEPSRNPSGRPKKALITDQLVKLLKQKDPKTGKPNAELVAAGLIKMLAQGKNVPEILNRIEGPVRAAEDDIAASSLNAVTKLLDRLDADGAA